MYKMILQSVALTLTLFSAAFAAASTDDITLVRSLLPAGTDLAQYQLGLLKKESPADLEEQVQNNFLFHDFDRDGLRDLIVISEANPTLFNYDTNQACTDYDPSDFNNQCRIIPGARTLKIFMGQSDGSLKLIETNDKIVLDADSGGVWGDPLVGLSLRPTGAVRLDVYGGSSWRWGHTDSFQYRNNHFFVTGQTDVGLHTLDPDKTFASTDINLITGEKIEERGTHKPVHGHIAVKPLVRLRDFVSPMMK